jgi:hypothetical protein
MRSFKDSADRTWTVAVNVDAIKRVRGLLDVNLLEIVEGKELLERLVGDPVLLCDLVYALVKPEADAQGVTAEDFGRAMAGDAIDGATTAFLEELVDFFPMRRRRLLAKALGKLDALERLAMKAAEKRLDGPELEQRLKALLADASGSSGSSPASPASPPAP